jgi:hypothetical protein
VNRILLFFALVVVGRLNAQPAGNHEIAVSNIRVELDTERVKIVYEVVNLSNEDSVYIQVESRRSGFLKPKTVTGAVGKAVLPGVNKRFIGIIAWMG